MHPRAFYFVSASIAARTPAVGPAAFEMVVSAYRIEPDNGVVGTVLLRLLLSPERHDDRRRMRARAEQGQSHQGNGEKS